jgi:hypothetical protein
MVFKCRVAPASKDFIANDCIRCRLLYDHLFYYANDREKKMV